MGNNKVLEVADAWIAVRGARWVSEIYLYLILLRWTDSCNLDLMNRVRGRDEYDPGSLESSCRPKEDTNGEAKVLHYRLAVRHLETGGSAFSSSELVRGSRR